MADYFEKILRNIRSLFSESRVVTVAMLAVISLAFSYQPLMSFGMVSTAHLELSVAIVAGIVVTLLSLPRIWSSRMSLGSSTWLRLYLTYVVFSGLTLTYSANPSRGVVLWLLIAALLGILMSVVAWRDMIYRHAPSLVRAAVIAVVVSCCFGWFQIIGEAAGLSRAVTLLPAMYESQVFGFARPTAFFAEPQFLANFLLIPIVWWSYILIKRQSMRRYEHVVYLLCVSLFTATLSRGGIVGLALGIMVLLIGHRPTIRVASMLMVRLGVTMLATLVLLSGIASLNYHHVMSGPAAFEKSVEQLTLGVAPFHNIDTSVPPVTPPVVDPTTPVTEPYVSSSSTDRLSMYRGATMVWLRDGTSFFVGVGIGGFGEALHQHDRTFSPGSVVNNQYLETTSELGVIGLGLLLGCLFIPLYRLYRHRAWVGIALIAALTVQWNFFSGYPNVLHIWVVLAIAASWPIKKPRDNLG